MKVEEQEACVLTRAGRFTPSVRLRSGYRNQSLSLDGPRCHDLMLPGLGFSSHRSDTRYDVIVFSSNVLFVLRTCVFVCLYALVHTCVCVCVCVCVSE